jgi:hypothetical protein
MDEEIKAERIVALQFASKYAETVEDLFTVTDKVLGYIATGKVQDEVEPADPESL